MTMFTKLAKTVLTPNNIKVGAGLFSATTITIFASSKSNTVKSIDNESATNKSEPPIWMLKNR